MRLYWGDIDFFVKILSALDIPSKHSMSYLAPIRRAVLRLLLYRTYLQGFLSSVEEVLVRH